MKLDQIQKQWLHEALRSLEAGCVRTYHDKMWLGFGDIWSQLESHLCSAGAIQVRGRHGEHVALTDRGAMLVRELQTVAA
ncbi:MAG: hypothetical protein AAF108_00720 [Planctomycetota bacterium]